jgi:polyisoprenyl-phosphate glycosyltransferase
MNNKIDCSIIIPVYNNEGSLEELFELIKSELFAKNPDLVFEIIFIDDGSEDNSLNVLLSLKNKEAFIKIIQFTRNFGSVNAFVAGLKIANGKFFVSLSADLQDPPELINQMIFYHLKENYQIIICSRIARQESFFRKFTSGIFFRLIKIFSFSQTPKGGFDCGLCGLRTREYILINSEANTFLQGMLLWTGYKIKYIPYTREKRKIGKSGWTFSKKLKYFIDGILSYSFFPIRLISLTGIILALLGFIYAFIILVAKVFGNIPLKGWASIIILILVLSGIQLLMLGIVGEYLWRTFDQVKRKQNYLIEKIYE